MAAFRDTGAHAEVVPLTENWASEAVFAVWQTDRAYLPDWVRATDQIAAHPNFTKELRRPSDSHQRKKTPASPGVGLTVPILRRRSRSLSEPTSNGWGCFPLTDHGHLPCVIPQPSP
jgi:hypothetical protein